MPEALGGFLSTVPLWLLASASGVLGAIWGSFVAALCSRWLNGESVMRGRSRCDACETTIAAYDLVPLLSYMALRGRCRTCGQRISPDHVGIELAAAAVGSLPFLMMPALPAFGVALFGWLLLPLIILDYRHLWLPNALMLSLALAGLMCAPLLLTDISMADRIIGGVAGFAALELLRRCYLKLRGREGIGGGDPKLLGALGLWLGWQALPFLILVASLVGLLFALSFYRRSKPVELQLPFGAYLGVSAFLLALYAQI